MVVGKGGMGKKTLAALKEHGAVYVNGIGGAAQYYARTVEKVVGVHLMEFGIPEAMWHIRVKDFAAMTRAYWSTIRSVDDSVGRLTPS